VNKFQYKPVIACDICYEYGPLGVFEKNHYCLLKKNIPPQYISLTHPTFEAHERKLKAQLTEPQQALCLFAPPCPNIKNNDNFYGTNVFAYGPPGVGKTFVLQLIVIAHMKRFGWNSILVVCLVGRLAAKLPLGATMNSTLGIREIVDEIVENYIAPLRFFKPYSMEHRILIEEFLSKCTPMQKEKLDALQFAK